MTAKQITYTATYTTEDGRTVTAKRTSHRPYTHAAVVNWGSEFPGTGTVIASFHSSEKLAAKGNLTGQQTAAGAKVIAVVPVTVKTDEAPAAETTETPALTGPAAISAAVDAAHAAADAKKSPKSGRKPASIKPRTPKAPKADATPAAEPTPSAADIEKAAAELAAEAPAPTNGHAVVEFFDHLIDTDAMTKTTARNLKGIFRSVMNGGHARGLNADVTKINAENVWDRYRTATPTITDVTAKVYRQHFLRAIALFTEYLADPQGWTPTGRSEARRPRQSHQEFDLGNGNVLRVTHTPGVDLKAALETALASIGAKATQEA